MSSLLSANIKKTALLSFPGNQSQLDHIKGLVLDTNQVMTKLDISKMPELEDFEIIDTPIETMDNTNIKELEFKKTSLKAFKNWNLPSLESLTIASNIQMANFSNNTCENLTTLVIESQNFTESHDNNFPKLNEVRMTDVPYGSVQYNSN